MSQVPSVTKDVAQTTVEVGRVFGAAGTDGLILYALFLGTLMMAVILGWVLWLNHRERTRAASDLLTQSTTFAAASDKTAEASKEVASALASSASADMTFKQTLIPIVQRLDERLTRLETDVHADRGNHS
jgi:hypothetical protein